MPPARALNDDAVGFGAIVKRLRTERRWTLEDLGRLSGMNSTYLGVLERGHNMPTLATILQLAEVFGVDAADIVREVEERRRAARAALTATKSSTSAPRLWPQRLRVLARLKRRSEPTAPTS